MMGMCYTFIQTHGMHNGVDTHVSYGLWVILMSRCQFIGCGKKYTTVVMDVDHERGNVHVGHGKR